jgi:hypothetical protein
MGKHLSVILATIFVALGTNVFGTELRRPISPSQPLIMVHADVWNDADPQKIIDLIPSDLRPYVVLNISVSINHDASTGKWKTSEYGYSIAKSWLRTAAENRIWATVQPSSGGYTHLADYDTTVDLDTTVYGEFFKNYPNFLGINYAEQFWGFGVSGDVRSPTWQTRVNHWQNLVKFANKYGGYVIVSFTGGFWGANINPVGMVKRNPGFAAVLKAYPQNFIIEEKFTMAYGFHDIESVSMGMWLSGFAGQYGIRFDQCGWVANNGESFPPAAGAAPYMEHMMLTGETVVDGPELIWQQSIKGLSNGTTSDGFSTRRWEYYPQYVNITLDGFRKVLDGTIRILSRSEVIERTKVVIINDQTTSDDRVTYSSPETLFDSLYKVTTDGTYLNNKSWFKKTGRYPAIPTVYQLTDSLANTFKVQVKRSAYSSRWPTLAAKQTEFNNLFPEEYTGTIYAAREENTWMTYNPFKTGVTASGSIPFKYNTATKLDVTYSLYSLGIIKEYPSKVSVYLTNYDNVNNTGLMPDELKFYGCSAEPTFSYEDRGIHTASTVSGNWSNSVYTLSVKHNGPLDITVNCSGTNTDRLTAYTTATITAPTTPSIYTGPRQYEAENFDFKSIAGNVSNGISGTIRNYQALGYLKFGTNASASIRDSVHAPIAGDYTLETRYSNSGSAVTAIDLYVNGVKVATPTFKATGVDSNFVIDTRTITLNAGTNVIMFKASSAPVSSVTFDNIVLTSLTEIKPVAPTVSITMPANNAVFSLPDTISMEATATDEDGTISHVDFYIGDSLAHAEWVAPYNFDWTDAVAGTYVIKAVAYDNDGNTASDTIQIKVESSVQIKPVVVQQKGPVAYQVFDLQGRILGTVVASNLLSLRNEIQKAFTKPGCYIVRSPSANGGSIQKVVIEPK